MNEDTQPIGLSGLQAVVTHEADGWVRFYTLTRRENGVLIWQGPFDGLSEEIEEMNK